MPASRQCCAVMLNYCSTRLTTDSGCAPAHLDAFCPASYSQIMRMKTLNLDTTIDPTRTQAATYIEQPTIQTSYINQGDIVVVTTAGMIQLSIQSGPKGAITYITPTFTMAKTTYLWDTMAAPYSGNPPGINMVYNVTIANQNAGVSRSLMPVTFLGGCMPAPADQVLETCPCVQSCQGKVSGISSLVVAVDACHFL